MDGRGRNKVELAGKGGGEWNMLGKIQPTFAVNGHGINYIIICKTICSILRLLFPQNAINPVKGQNFYNKLTK